MKLFVSALILALFFLTLGRGEENTSDTITEQERQEVEKVKETTQEELDKIKNVKHDAKVGDPGVFEYAKSKMMQAIFDKMARDRLPKELKDPELRSKLSPEQIAYKEKKHAVNLENDKKEMRKSMGEELDRNKAEISKLTKVEVDEMVKELIRDLENPQEMLKKAEL